MSTPTSPEYEFQGMIKHLDSLYTMAQVLTLDTEKASVLVEETYKRALKFRENNPISPSDRRHLLQLLIQVYNEQKSAETAPLVPLTTAQQPKSKESFKQRIISQFLNQSVPAGFASLSDADRVLISLCEIKKLSHADAALILGGDSDAIGIRLNAAKKRLLDIVEVNAPPAIQNLIKEARNEDWLAKMLHQSIKEEFAAIPPRWSLKFSRLLQSRTQKQHDAHWYLAKPSKHPSLATGFHAGSFLYF